MDLNLIVSVAVFVGTMVLIWLTVLLVIPKKPSFRLDQMRVSPYVFDGTLADVGEFTSVSLVFVNDGPGIATAVNALAVGALTDDSLEEFQFPADGSPTMPVGETLEIQGRFRSIAHPSGWPMRKYLHGDDYYFDLTHLKVRFEWGKPKKRRSVVLGRIHESQQRASPQVEEPTDEWRRLSEKIRNQSG